MSKPPGKRPAKSRGAKPPLARAANGRFASTTTVTQTQAIGNTEDIRDIARHHTRLALETLAQVAASSPDEKTRLAAAEALLDRGWGRPVADKRESADSERDGKPIVVRVETGIRRNYPIKRGEDGSSDPK